MERKEKIGILVWGLSMLYALAASLYTTLFGCSCADPVAMGDCHRMHLPEILGAVGWMLLIPAGLWLFRRQKDILRVFDTYIGATLACSGLWLAESISRSLGREQGIGYSPGGVSTLLLTPVHGFHGVGGLSERGWILVVFLWTLLLCVFSVWMEKKYHPRTEKIRLTFSGVYKILFVLLGVLHLFFTAEALDFLLVSNPDRLPAVWYMIVTTLWLAVTVGGLRHFRRDGWMKGLFVLCLIRSIGLLGGGISFCLQNGWFLIPILLVGCTSPMLLPVELFWNLLSYGPPEEVICFMALVLEAAVMIPAWVRYRRDSDCKKPETAERTGV